MGIAGWGVTPIRIWSPIRVSFLSLDPCPPNPPPRRGECPEGLWSFGLFFDAFFGPSPLGWGVTPGFPLTPVLKKTPIFPLKLPGALECSLAKRLGAGQCRLPEDGSCYRSTEEDDDKASSSSNDSHVHRAKFESRLWPYPSLQWVVFLNPHQL